MSLPSTIRDVVDFLIRIAPPELAEDWDNVGLLVGDPGRDASKIMTCLTITEEVVAEGVDRKADLIVTHHPLPFRPLQGITTETEVGGLLWQIIGARISVYSAHTAFDSAAEGINQQLAQALDLDAIHPLILKPGIDPSLGSGRVGDVRGVTTGVGIADLLRSYLGIIHLRGVGAMRNPVRRVAIGCGSAGSFVDSAVRTGCDLIVMGEMTFHQCLHAQATGLRVLMVGHFASERFAMENLAGRLAQEFSGSTVWASDRESDPLVLL